MGMMKQYRRLPSILVLVIAAAVGFAYLRFWGNSASAGQGGTAFTGGGKLPWDATGMTELSKFEASYARKSKRR